MIAYTIDICKRCNKHPVRPNRTTCVFCAKAISIYGKTKNAYRKTNGLCRDCDEPANIGKSLCEPHRKREYSKWKKRTLERIAAGLCRNSCGEAVVGNTTYCRIHYLRRKSLEYFGSYKHADHLEQLLCIQQDCCFYCGINLILGQNTTLDHKLSRKRFKQFSHHLDNIVWACFQCNKAKSDMTIKEFTDLCKKVASRWQ